MILTKSLFASPKDAPARAVVLTLSLWLGLVTVHAESMPNVNTAHLELQTISVQMVNALQDPAVRQNVERIQGLVVDNLVPHIDFRVSSHLVLGEHWKQATDGQRDAFMAEFQSFLVRFYTGALASYVDSADIPQDIIRFDDAPSAKGQRQAVVRSKVGQSDGDAVPVDYRMYWDGAWKVIDVSVAGISMVQNYRSNFHATVRDSGLDALIAQLYERNQAISTH